MYIFSKYLLIASTSNIDVDPMLDIYSLSTILNHSNGLAQSVSDSCAILHPVVTFIRTQVYMHWHCIYCGSCSQEKNTFHRYKQLPI